MNDVMTLLADANPVRAEGLDELQPAGLAPRRTPSRGLVAALLATTVAASLAGALLLLGGTGSHQTGSRPPGPKAPQGLPGPAGPSPPTVAHPLPSGDPVTLPEAAIAIGQPIVLPDTPVIRPKSAGQVWAWSHDTRADVAVTYPREGLIIYYQRPFPYVDPLASYTGFSAAPTHVFSLGHIPAMWIRGNDGTGRNDVLFQIDDLGIDVMGPYGEGTLRSVARSIVDRSGHPNDPGNNLLPTAPPPKTPVGIGRSSKALGTRIVLPALSLVRRSVPHAWSAGRCPPGGGRRCLIWVKLPKLTLLYEHPSPWPRSTYRQLVRMSPRFRLVELGGLPALMVPWQKEGKIPASVDFIVGGVRIVVWGRYGAADLQAIAASIIENSRTS